MASRIVHRRRWTSIFQLFLKKKHFFWCEFLKILSFRKLPFACTLPPHLNSTLSSHQRINYDLSSSSPSSSHKKMKIYHDLKRCTVISTKPLPSVHTPNSFEAPMERKRILEKKAKPRLFFLFYKLNSKKCSETCKFLPT